jgi:hypothetical protein
MDAALLISSIASASVAAFVTLLSVRWSSRKDLRDKANADDVASDRIIKLVKEQYQLQLENERLKFQAKLQDELARRDETQRREMDEFRESLRADMRREMDEILDTYGCELAPDCADHKPRVTGA